MPGIYHYRFKNLFFVGFGRICFKRIYAGKNGKMENCNKNSFNHTEGSFALLFHFNYINLHTPLMLKPLNLPLLLMSKRCKIRSKKIFPFGLIAIVFIITLQVNAGFKRNTAG